MKIRLAASLVSIVGLATATHSFADETPPVFAEVTIARPVADVWRAWTTADINTFLGERSAIELKVGGKFEIYMSMEPPEGQRGSEGCRVLAYLPNRFLAFSWNAPPKFAAVRNGEHKAQVIVEFETLGTNETRVRLTHHDFGSGGEWPAVREYFAAAWPRVLAGCKSALERGNAAAGAKPD